MKVTSLSSCFISPSISVEQFIHEHFFLYLVSGSMLVYDGHKEYKIKGGDCGIARRNHLAKYSKIPDNGEFQKVVLFFDQEFLKTFQDKNNFPVEAIKPSNAVVELEKNPRIDNFIQSLTPYFNEKGKIEDTFLDVKRTELLLILLKEKPGLATILFDFSIPEKIDLEKFMNSNYKFNITLERFAYMTGRSLSTFKRDFDKIFNDTPSHWLIHERLQEAHFLIEKKNQKPAEIYLDLGFEDLSHFSYAFKKLYGHNPTELMRKVKS